MALKGLDIFKLTPKTNCKECVDLLEKDAVEND